ncbi:MAG: phenylalanine--tRNA ligase subunit beta [Actinomycetes bacterium]
MRAPLSWLRDYADLPPDVSARDVASRFVAAGLEVEGVDIPAAHITGPLIVGAVLSYDEEQHSNGKTIRWCQVSTGSGEPRGIVCGARNFEAGDHVVVALPGAVLPGGFEIGARKTYGHVSDGMICSARELALGDDHTGILVLPPDTKVGDDAVTVLGLDDAVFDLAVSPDRGYCLSIRGLARELATSYGVAFRDPADVPPTADEAGAAPVIDDPTGCDRFVAVRIEGVDGRQPTPQWMSRRLHACGMRPISLIVDVTNYVMLELGQPLHAYDAALLRGTLGVRRARDGEKLETLDGVRRGLHLDDLVIFDDSGVIGLAGVMGGASTEISSGTTDIVLEAAHFEPTAIARTARRHKLGSEASRRFERGVDVELAPHAAARAAELIAAHGKARIIGRAETTHSVPLAAITLAADLPQRLAGAAIDAEIVVRLLGAVGCEVSGTTELAVRPPSWRPDLTDPYDLVEEVVRLHGYDRVPSVLPTIPPGRGLTARQRLRRRIGAALAVDGYVETPCYPFVGAEVFDLLDLPADDPRRRALALANPLSDEEPLLRTTLLPGLLAALRRNLSRGLADVALFETGLVFRPDPAMPLPPRPGVAHPPTPEELTGLQAALPHQPERIAVVLAGCRELPGWWGGGRAAQWVDAIAAARTVAWAADVDIDVRSDGHAPWHPGRCAGLYAGDRLVGHAGELHPRVCAALELPVRTCAMELDLDLLTPTAAAPVRAPALSPYPPATQDVALVVDRSVPAAEVERALRAGAGALLESVRLFDVYEGEQLGADKKSLAFALRFRAPDRTLTSEEATAARDAAVGEATRLTGALLRT